MNESPSPFSTETLELLQVLAFLYLQNNHPQKAVTLLKAADHAEGCQPTALIVLALAQLRSGTAQEALNTLDRVPASYTLDPSYYAVRAQILSALKRYEEARAAMHAYVKAKNGTDKSAKALPHYF